MSRFKRYTYNITARKVWAVGILETFDVTLRAKMECSARAKLYSTYHDITVNSVKEENIGT